MMTNVIDTGVGESDSVLGGVMEAAKSSQIVTYALTDLTSHFLPPLR